jgi:hypothetical protein
MIKAIFVSGRVVPATSGRVRAPLAGFKMTGNTISEPKSSRKQRKMMLAGSKQTQDDPQRAGPSNVKSVTERMPRLPFATQAAPMGGHGRLH